MYQVMSNTAPKIFFSKFKKSSHNYQARTRTKTRLELL